jgi:hypothetical protein
MLKGFVLSVWACQKILVTNLTTASTGTILRERAGGTIGRAIQLGPASYSHHL